MGTSLSTSAKAAAMGSDGQWRLGTDENSAARPRHSFFKMKISAERTSLGLGINLCDDSNTSVYDCVHV